MLPLKSRRSDDTTLAELADLSSNTGSKCPNQAAEIHAYLHRVARAARGLFQTVLEGVATTKGLALP